ncbi:LemA family protein [Branchiibius cervicis]|uniref:LemA family protein n=1 Tax=Branchiibius cervicis TaxID=908252 RepID=A0ABW2AW96_9MICO
MIFLLIILVLIVLAGFFTLGQYNGLVKQKNLVQESWHQVDVELKRRHDLIPNLVNTVQGYAQHESGTLQDVMKARSAAMNASSPHEAAAAEGQLSQALGRLIAVSEAYPDLKANQNFVALQNELTATEDRIASARRYYNANVRELNTKIETVPSKFFAGMAGANRADYFEAEDAALQTPNVQFGPGARPPPRRSPSIRTPGSCLRRPSRRPRRRLRRLRLLSRFPPRSRSRCSDPSSRRSRRSSRTASKTSTRAAPGTFRGPPSCWLRPACSSAPRSRRTPMTGRAPVLGCCRRTR